jgi:hypothetical protein
MDSFYRVFSLLCRVSRGSHNIEPIKKLNKCGNKEEFISLIRIVSLADPIKGDINLLIKYEK